MILKQKYLNMYYKSKYDVLISANNRRVRHFNR